MQCEACVLRTLGWVHRSSDTAAVDVVTLSWDYALAGGEGVAARGSGESCTGEVLSESECRGSAQLPRAARDVGVPPISSRRM